MSTLLLNGLLLLIQLLLFRRSKQGSNFWFAARSLLVLGTVALFASVTIALTFGESGFGVFRLLAWAVFLHGPLAFVLIARRCRQSRATFTGSLALAAALLAIAADAFLIEPHWLEVTHTTIESAKITEPIRLVLVADIQTDHVGAYEREVMQRVMAEQPDAILFAGDYIQLPWREIGPQHRALGKLFAEVGLEAPLGLFAVEGNTDSEGWERVFGRVDAHVFSKSGAVRAGPLLVTGLACADSFNPNLRVEPSSAFHIVLGHAPNFALGDIDADLLLAGHCHGGQVRLPFIGPLLTLAQVPRSWAAGISQLDEDSTLIVSRGVGMERSSAPRLRFLCRPEIVVIDLLPASTAN